MINPGVFVFYFGNNPNPGRRASGRETTMKETFSRFGDRAVELTHDEWIAVCQIKKASIARLERMGFNFSWAYSAYRCCVHLNRKWLGTYDTKRAYAIPRDAIIETCELE